VLSCGKASKRTNKGPLEHAGAKVALGTKTRHSKHHCRGMVDEEDDVWDLSSWMGTFLNHTTDFLGWDDKPWSWVDSIKSPVTLQSHQNSSWHSLITTLEIHWAICICSSRFMHYFSCKLCSHVERPPKGPTKGHSNIQEQRWPLGQKLAIANITVGVWRMKRTTFGTSPAEWGHFPTTQPTFLAGTTNPGPELIA
jgi:hypothetical protein